MITPSERLKLFNSVENILRGIDQTQTDTDSDVGWWETSAGAEFGWRKMEELKELILTSDE